MKINCRHLGLVRSFCDPQSVASKILITEMAARTIKKELCRKLREEMKKLRMPLEEPYKVLIVKELNILLRNDENTELKWKINIKNQIGEQFSSSLFENEKFSTFDLRNSLSSLQFFFKRLFALVGIQLSLKAESDLYLSFVENKKFSIVGKNNKKILIKNKLIIIIFFFF